MSCAKGQRTLGKGAKSKINRAENDDVKAISSFPPLPAAAQVDKTKTENEHGAVNKEKINSRDINNWKLK